MEVPSVKVRPKELLLRTQYQYVKIGVRASLTADKKVDRLRRPTISPRCPRTAWRLPRVAAVPTVQGALQR